MAMVKTRRRHIRWDRVLKSLFFTAMFIFIAWVAISYLNVVLHNSEEHPMYFSWNFFNYML